MLIMKNFIEEFKSFAMKGNVIDLAVAVVIGAVVHSSALISDGSLNATGVALIFLVGVLLAGAALGTRGAAKRLGAVIEASDVRPVGRRDIAHARQLAAR